jgi:hypothetical protein
MGGLPLSFEENRGQAQPSVRFLARTPGCTSKISSQGAILDLWDPGKPSCSAEVRISLAGTTVNSDPVVTGSKPLPGIVTYCLGPDPRRWVSGVPTWASVTLADAYAGIDWVFYGDQSHLEYDFVLHPGADPNQIVLHFEGITKITLAPDGGLILDAPAGQIRQDPPVVYQSDHSGRHTVQGSFCLLGPTRVGFRLGQYDQASALTIDPTLVYSTFFGSTNPAFNAGIGIAVDSTNNIYVTGNTLITPGGAVFVSKFNPAGNALLYSFALGGSSGQQAMGIAVDSEGNACVIGTTSSLDFPLKNPLPNPFQDATDYFLVKVNPQGTAFVFSTFLGSIGSFGSTADRAGVAVDPTGNIYVAGTTASPNFPVSAKAFQKHLRNDFNDSFLRSDAFVAKLNPMGSLAYSTYIGGNGTDSGNAIAVDASGFAFLTGTTFSVDYPTTTNAPYNGAFLNATEAVVTKLTQDGSALVYSTYIQAALEGHGIAVDAEDSAYLTGFAGGPGLPTTASAFQPDPGGSHDAYLVKLDPTGSSIAYATYLGGGGGDEANGIAVARDGSAAITGFTGFTASIPFPATNSFQPFRGDQNAFVAKFAPSGDIMYATYLGGSRDDSGNGIALDATGNVYVIGQTESPDFPLTNAFQSVYLQGEAFISKISDSASTNSVTTPPSQITQQFYAWGFAPNGDFNLSLYEPVPQDYELQASSDLVTWVNVTAFTANAQSPFQYSDQFAPVVPVRFYRVIPLSGGGKR